MYIILIFIYLDLVISSCSKNIEIGKDSYKNIVTPLVVIRLAYMYAAFDSSRALATLGDSIRTPHMHVKIEKNLDD